MNFITLLENNAHLYKSYIYMQDAKSLVVKQYCSHQIAKRYILQQVVYAREYTLQLYLANRVYMEVLKTPEGIRRTITYPPLQPCHRAVIDNQKFYTGNQKTVHVRMQSFLDLKTTFYLLLLQKNYDHHSPHIFLFCTFLPKRFIAPL